MHAQRRRGHRGDIVAVVLSILLVGRLLLAAGVPAEQASWVSRPGPGADAAGVLVRVSKQRVLALAATETTRGLVQRDPKTGAWAPRAPLPRPRIDYDVVVLRGGDILVVGGGETSTYDRSTSETWRYDPGRDTWDIAAPLPVARLGQATARLADGRVLVAGGVDATGAPLSRVDVYDPVTDHWTQAADLTHARSGAVAFPLTRGGAIVHGGDGRDTSGKAFLVSRFERWDPRRDRWRAGDVPPRHEHVGVALAGTGLVIGGNADYREGWGILEIERFDAQANAWTTVGQLHDERSLGPVAVVLPARHSLVVVGGLAETVEVVDLRRGTSTPSVPLPPEFGTAVAGLAIDGHPFVVNIRGEAMSLEFEGR
ncbi:Kelch repeat-containing protein [Nannocystis pusilla]|uniref:Kelch repeat-containing protein n=1 Tax=Nannocystis pusilla TaxID=889268 RepID=UPI003BF3B574